GLFSTGAIAGALWDIHAGLQRATIEVTRSGLRLRQESPVRSRDWEWTREQIGQIAVGPSWLSKNRRPIPELQIRARDGGAELLAGRDEAELQWIAALLQAALDRV